MTSLYFRESAFAQETGSIPIVLITITHPTLIDPIRLSSDPTQRITELTTASDVVYGTISRGDRYIYYPMQIKLPDDTDEGGNEINITIDNIHRDLTPTIRSITSPAVFCLEMVLDSTPDLVEISWPAFNMTNVQYNAQTITATLSLETLVSEPFPAGSFTPAAFPALF